MRRTLFHIPHEVADIPVFGAGWLLAAWAIVSVLTVAWLVWRQGWNRDTTSYLPVLMVIGAAIWLLLPVLEERGPSGDPIGLPIRGYGVMLLCGFASAVGLAAYLAHRMGLHPELMYSAAVWLFVGGIFGARAFYVIQKWDQFQQPTVWETVGEILRFTEGGLVVYGSVIGGLAVGIAWVRVHGLPLLAMADLITPSMALGLALGRVGCLMNGCCYGGLCEQSWALAFPPDSPPHVEHHAAGLLHGFEIGQDERGRPMIARVSENSPAQQVGLRPGMTLRSIQLPPESALIAATSVQSWRGEVLEVVVAGKQQPIRVPIGALEESGEPGAMRRLGFLVSAIDDQAVVTRLRPDSAAERAGLRMGDEVLAIQLPALRSAVSARQVLLAAESIATLETTTGRQYSITARPWPQPSLPIHPTQIYAAINAALLALLAWFFYPYRQRDGQVFALILTLYPITRILLEVVRTDEQGMWGTPLTISQIVSIGLLVAIGPLWLHIQRGAPDRALPLPAAGHTS